MANRDLASIVATAVVAALAGAIVTKLFGSKAGALGSLAVVLVHRLFDERVAVQLRRLLPDRA